MQRGRAGGAESRQQGAAAAGWDLLWKVTLLLSGRSERDRKEGVCYRQCVSVCVRPRLHVRDHAAAAAAAAAVDAAAHPRASPPPSCGPSWRAPGCPGPAGARVTSPWTSGSSAGGPTAPSRDWPGPCTAALRGGGGGGGCMQ